MQRSVYLSLVLSLLAVAVQAQQPGALIDLCDPPAELELLPDTMLNEEHFPVSIADGMDWVQPVSYYLEEEGGGQASGGGQEDNGTNPAQNITTFILTNEYYTLEGNDRINTTYLRYKFPTFGKRGSLLFELPLVYYNFQATDPNLPNVGGLGDIKLQGSFNTWTSPEKRLTMINFLEMYLPSADNAIIARGGGNDLTAFNLGTGKYVIGPGLGFVYAFAPNCIVAPLYFYEASVFGDSDRQDIRRGKWRLFFMYAWQSGFYVLPEFQLLTNYLTENNDAYVAPEIGFAKAGTTMYVKPGVGINPDFGDRDWGLEFGFRVQF